MMSRPGAVKGFGLEIQHATGREHAGRRALALLHGEIVARAEIHLAFAHKLARLVHDRRLDDQRVTLLAQFGEGGFEHVDIVRAHGREQFGEIGPCAPPALSGRPPFGRP
jgi:hypothetical protein